MPTFPSTGARVVDAIANVEPRARPEVLADIEVWPSDTVDVIIDILVYLNVLILLRAHGHPLSDAGVPPENVDHDAGAAWVGRPPSMAE